MSVHFTDLTVRGLKPGTYFDDATRGFGIRVGAHRKTWLVVKGEGRTKVRIGHYPHLSLAEARKKALITLGTPGGTRSAPTFPDALDGYLSQTRWKPSTRYTVEKCLRKHFKWTRALDKITPEDIAAVTDKLTPGASGEALKNIRAFFNWCVPRYIDKSPCVGFRSSGYRPKQRVLSDDELSRVWNAAQGSFGAIVKLLILTGQRRGEIATLRWGQVGDDRITLHDTKNGRPHEFPIGDRSAGILGSLSPAKSPKAGTLVFPVPGKPGSYFAGWSKSLKRLHKDSQTSDWSLHDLRRTFATGLASLNVPIHVTEKLLNHVSGTTGGIVGVYQKHQYWDGQVTALDAWEKHLKAILSAPERTLRRFAS